jgi:hypothetical protein
MMPSAQHEPEKEHFADRQVRSVGSDDKGNRKMDIKDIIYTEDMNLDEPDTVGVTLHTEGLNRRTLGEQWRKLVESNHGYSRVIIYDPHETILDLFGKFKSPEDASRFLAAHNKYYTHPSEDK